MLTNTYGRNIFSRYLKMAALCAGVDCVIKQECCVGIVNIDVSGAENGDRADAA